MGNSPAAPIKPSKNPSFECPNCNRLYLQKYDWRKHKENCGLPPHLQCEFCPQKVHYKRNLRYHLKKYHMDEIETEQRLEDVIVEIAKKGKSVRGGYLRAVEDGTQEQELEKKNYYVIDRVNLYCSSCEAYYDEKSFKNSSCPKCKTPFIYECRKCKKYDRSQTRIKNHIIHKCFPKKILACDCCHFKTTKKSTLKQHIASKHLATKDFHTCPKCNKKIKHLNNFKRHEQYCGNQKTYQCQICSRKIKYKVNFDRHMHRHKLLEHDPYVKIEDVDKMKVENLDENKNLITSGVHDLILAYCSKCNESCMGKYRMTRCQKCRNKLSYRCGSENCDKEFERRSDLYRHACTTHMTADFTKVRCQKCSKTFVDCYRLEKHQRHVCNDKEPHLQCNHCPFRSKRKFNLIDHITRKHSEPDVVQCENCGKLYQNKASFNSHLRYCESAPDIECLLCDFKTKVNYYLVEHIRSKHVELFTEKNLKCDKCFIEIKNIYLFEQHVQKCNVDYFKVNAGERLTVETCKS